MKKHKKRKKRKTEKHIEKQVDTKKKNGEIKRDETRKLSSNLDYRPSTNKVCEIRPLWIYNREERTTLGRRRGGGVEGGEGKKKRRREI